MSIPSPELRERLGGTQAIVIGGSAGAFDALDVLLSDLGAGPAVPLALVVHLPHGRRSALAGVLERVCGCPAGEPEDKEPLRAGRVYVAPADYHLLFERGPAFALSIDEPVNYSRPSIDVLFESAAEVFGARLVAVVLSGANADGALGLRHVCSRGGIAVVQAPEEASSPEMPRAALAACPEAIVCPVAGIRELLDRLLWVPPPGKAPLGRESDQE